MEWVRKVCKGLPHTTEQMQWGDHLVFKIGGKMYAVISLEPAGNCMSLKVPDEEFAGLCEVDGVIPAPYLARAKWVALEREDALPAAEVKRLVRQAYELVKAKLPKKVREGLQ
jgi:predicted DNA-binding protein (MmcQ/YjbR family)